MNFAAHGPCITSFMTFLWHRPVGIVFNRRVKRGAGLPSNKTALRQRSRLLLPILRTRLKQPSIRRKLRYAPRQEGDFAHHEASNRFDS
jgi:hypothetical protein